MNAARTFDYDEFPIGPTRDETRLVAKRQFIASVLVGCVILAGAALLRFVPHEPGTPASHGLAQVQQPIFVNQGVASARQIELP